ncbi:S1/P1 nuclease [Botrimarina sp.]|uniref:S1/P1 nuclease n=1 Tax=Botrimarina sp. TaxID=2795802 RepID=UPI0032EE9D13
MLARLVAILAIALAAPVASLAWNSPGHQCIDVIAWGQLSEADQERAVALLADHPRFAQHFAESVPSDVWRGSEGEKRVWAFAHAGTWPDQVRSSRGAVSREDVSRFNRPTWHYVNLPVFLTPDDREALGKQLPGNRDTEPPADPDASGQNVVQAIGSALRVLGDDSAPRADRAVALCWFLHLAADSHQPCHSSALYSAGRFPEGDKGGNAIPISGPGGNLHAFWDQALLPRRTDFSRVRVRAVQFSQEHAEAGEAAADELAPKDWLRESWRLAGSAVYTASVREAVYQAEGAVLLDPVQLDTAYYKQAGAVSHRRAAEAGYRIAAMLAGRLPDGRAPRPLFTAPAPADEIVAGPAPARGSPAAASGPFDEAQQTHWLNTKSNKRHNRSCRNFGNTKQGRYCGPEEGEPCGICNG